MKSSVPLKREAEIVPGQSPPSEEVAAFAGNELPFLQGNAEFGLEHPTPIYQCRTAPRRAIRGDILISVRAPVGALNIADREYAIGRGLVAVRPSRHLERRFCWWWLHSVVQLLKKEGTGSTYEAVTGADVGRLLVPVVPIVRQRAIADFLDTETARIDALVGKKRCMIGRLHERAIGEVDHALRLRLDWSQASVPRPFADPWPVAPLGFLADVQTGLTLDEARVINSDVPSIPYIRVANVQDGSLDLSDLKKVRVPLTLANRCMLKAGDVLMTEGGDPDKLGRGAVWPGEPAPCLHQNHVFAVRPRSQLLPEYLALITRSTYARAYFEATAVKTTGIASTNTAKISAFRLPLPDLQTQAEAVLTWTALDCRLSSARERLLLQIAVIQERRKELITAAVTGELEIPGMAA